MRGLGCRPEAVLTSPGYGAVHLSECRTRDPAAAQFGPDVLAFRRGGGLATRKRLWGFQVQMAGTVAVVDDDEDVREVLGLLLETAGHMVRPYPSGSLLLSDQDIGQIDCVIIDQNMPELTGTDVLLEIERRGLVLPSVLITGVLAPEPRNASVR
jgi:CheY-like chemotaxis protein